MQRMKKTIPMRLLHVMMMLTKLFCVLTVTFCEGHWSYRCWRKLFQRYSAIHCYFSEGNGHAEVAKNDFNDTPACDDDAQKYILCSHINFCLTLLLNISALRAWGPGFIQGWPALFILGLPGPLGQGLIPSAMAAVCFFRRKHHTNFVINTLVIMIILKHFGVVGPISAICIQALTDLIFVLWSLIRY